MAGIFISYRRDDVPGDARGICEALARRLGDANVFMDIDHLLAGQRFDRELEKALARCDVLIAVIGPRWMDQLAARAGGDERDYVRAEIATALSRGIVVIPILVGREGHMPTLPRANELPPDIRDLVLHQKHEISHESFGRDMADLIAAIRIVQRAGRPALPWKPIGIGLAVVLLLGGGGALYQYTTARTAQERARVSEEVRRAEEERQKLIAQEKQKQQPKQKQESAKQEAPQREVSAPPADCPNPEAKPVSGRIELREFFEPDPSRHRLVAGGGRNLAKCRSAWKGWVSSAPDLQLVYNTSGKTTLSISIESDIDTVLLVNDPSGAWHFDDDSGPGLNGSVTLPRARQGRYEIWVGTFTEGRGNHPPVTVLISEQ